MNEIEKNKTNKNMSPVLAVLEYVETLRENHKALMERIREARDETKRNMKLTEDIRVKRLETERRVESKCKELAELTKSLRSETRSLHWSQVVLGATEKRLEKTKSELNERKALRTELRDVMTELAKLKISSHQRRESVLVSKRTKSQCESELRELKRIRNKFQFSVKQKETEISNVKEECDYVVQCSGVLKNTSSI